MKLYCGIDLHSNNSVISILDENDTVVLESRLPNDLDVVLNALMPYRDSLCGCVVESTYNWYWLVDGLMASGIEVHLASPAGMKQYDGLKYADDRSDARYLARLLRLGILPEGYIYPKAERAVRDQLRRRALMVRQRTVHQLSLQGLIARHTGRRLNANAMAKLDDEGLEALLGDDAVAMSAKASLGVIQALNHACETLEREVYAHVKQRREFVLLTTIPGVGKALGMTIALETGDIRRFPDAGHYASYARCVTSQRLSNAKRKGQGNRKNGNRYLAWAMFEAGHFAAIWEPRVKRYYQRKRATSHLMVAKKAVANKLARACYHMLTRDTPFVAERAFG